MRKTVIMVLLLFFSGILVKAQDTVYLHKSGVVVYKRAVADIDSIIFYQPDLCGTSIVTDADGNTYNTVHIGTQCWMRENLKVTKYRNGNNISLITDGSVWNSANAGAYCYYGNNPANTAIYGNLYNFYAGVDSRNLCPQGWHVPTNAEWTTLTTFLGLNAGGKLKEPGTIHWNTETCGGTCNETGFTALPGGNRNYDGSIYDLLTYFGYFWTSTDNSGSPYYKRLTYYNSEVETSNSSYYTYGMSVRCIRD